MAATGKQWTDNDFEAYAKSLLNQAGRSEWTFQAIKDELEMEPYFERLSDEVCGDENSEGSISWNEYEDELDSYAAEVETFMDFMEE